MLRSITNNPRHPSRNQLLFVSWLSFVIFTANFFFFLASTYRIETGDEDTGDTFYVAPKQDKIQQQQQSFLNDNDSHRNKYSDKRSHRRLQEHKTLSPEARATIRMAHEMALSKAKENRHFLYDNKPDPLQDMQARAQENHYQANNSATITIDAEEDASKIQELQTSINWKDVDPLTMSDNSFARIEALPRLELEPQVDYLGVTVDCARHYFPIQWWKRLILYLHKLRYNMIHLRLTDDENFVVRLDSYPQLAFSTDGPVYTPKELEGLVALAKGYGITIIPEVNLPLRAASWSGIPGMIVGCPNIICDMAHYVPLNVRHQDFETILQGVLGEVISIFDKPPMLHLGGSMSLRDANGCFEEAGVAGMSFGSKSQYMESFETVLSAVLMKLSYPEEQVIRMHSLESIEANKGDVLAQQLLAFQVGGIDHHWISLPDETEITAPENWEKTLISAGVDLSVDTDVNSVNIYQNTLKILQLKHKPKGIIVGTQTLGVNFWLEQNILARLISVAMAAALDTNSATASVAAVSSFPASYKAKCMSILTGKSHSLCELHGRPTTTVSYYLSVQMKARKAWKQSICNRLAASTEERIFQPYKPNQNYASTMGNEIFWRKFHRPPEPHKPAASLEGPKAIQLVEEVKEWNRGVVRAGLILDLANSLVSLDDLKKLVRDYIAPLGLDLLQIRLSDDFAFAIKLEADTKLAQSEWDVTIPTASDFKDFVDIAKTEWHMDVVPEVSVTTNAGGWIKRGVLGSLPKALLRRWSGYPK